MKTILKPTSTDCCYKQGSFLNSLPSLIHSKVNHQLSQTGQITWKELLEYLGRSQRMEAGQCLGLSVPDFSLLLAAATSLLFSRSWGITSWDEWFSHTFFSSLKSTSFLKKNFPKSFFFFPSELKVDLKFVCWACQNIRQQQETHVTRELFIKGLDHTVNNSI